MSEVVVKQASLQDLDQLVAWRMETLADVFSDEIAAQPDSDVKALKGANSEYYRHTLPAGQHIAVLAEVDGETAGCGGMCLQAEMPSPDNPAGQCAYLMNIYTRPCYRGRGVGRAVVSYLIDEARKRDIAKVYLETTDMARPLYQSLGFADMVGYMKLDRTEDECGETAH